MQQIIWNAHKIAIEKALERVAHEFAWKAGKKALGIYGVIDTLLETGETATCSWKCTAGASESDQTE